MSPSTSQRLLHEFVNAELAFRLVGTPIPVFLRRRAARYIGETKREMLRVAALGPGAEMFMDIFLAEFIDG